MFYDPNPLSFVLSLVLLLIFLGLPVWVLYWIGRYFKSKALENKEKP